MENRYLLYACVDVVTVKQTANSFSHDLNGPITKMCYHTVCRYLHCTQVILSPYRNAILEHVLHSISSYIWASKKPHHSKLFEKVVRMFFKFTKAKLAVLV